LRRIDEKQVNHMLMSHGLGKLDDPGLVPQLRFVVSRVIKTHEQFRELLNRCEGSKRYAMYEALHSALPFQAKPLDVYIAELADLAERKQLPIVQPDGTLAEFKVPEISSQPAAISDRPDEALEAAYCRPAEEKLAQALVEETAAEKFLELVCRSCTRGETFAGWNKDAAIAKAREAGWRDVYSTARQEHAELCPVCIEKYWPSLK
jgi:hypothetical protein